MGLTSAFNNAFSGLNASSRRAELVSNNISNAMTEGFARREIHLDSDVLNGFGGGVRVTDVTRIENAVVSSARREAEAKVSSVSTTADTVSRFAEALGNPDEMGALAVQYSELESAFTAAANDPSNDQLLGGVVDRAHTVANTLNDLSGLTNELRLVADGKIGRQVEIVNSTLSRLSSLNTEIRERAASGGSTNSLKDQQNQLLDQLNTIIPVKVAERDFGRIAIFTPSGGTLLDGKVTQLEFSKVPAMAHGMTIANGALSGLLVNGTPVAMNSGNGFFDGGSLSSLFALRDNTLPQLNDEIDGLAVDLISRFQGASVDPTLSVTDPGLFTDAGSQYLPGGELGIAGRITLNSAVDPQQGGQVWRLRDGINAATPGDIGLNSTLRNYQGAFQASLAPAVGMSATRSLSASGFAEQLASEISWTSVSQEDNLVFERANFEELRETELSIVGVDTDAELQDLMEVEAAYAANARVMSVLDELLNRLLEI